jgi:hypothetical protein
MANGVNYQAFVALDPAAARPAAAPVQLRGLQLSEALPPVLATLFSQYPLGIARNIINASLQIRIPKEIVTLDALDQWAEQEKANSAILKDMEIYTADIFRQTVIWIGLAQANTRAAAPHTVTQARTPEREATFRVEVRMEGTYYRRVLERVSVSDAAEMEIPLSIAEDGEEAIRVFVRDRFYEDVYEFEETDVEHIETEDTFDPEYSDSFFESASIEEILEWAESMNGDDNEEEDR